MARTDCASVAGAVPHDQGMAVGKAMRKLYRPFERKLEHQMHNSKLPSSSSQRSDSCADTALSGFIVNVRRGYDQDTHDEMIWGDGKREVHEE
jgi:hypothetical protein